MPSSRPNILLLMTDQQRFDTIAALGNSIIKTPALDRLVRQGTAFTRCYTPSPVCVSARHALVTGLSPSQTGCTDNDGVVRDDISLMQRLSEVGYQTHGVGKMHFNPPRKLWGFESRDFSEEGGGRDDYRIFLDENGYDHVEDPHGVRSEFYYLPQPSQVPARLHHTQWTADRSLDFLDRRDQTRPFFLWTSFIKPHPPFEAPTPWHRLYRAAEMEPPTRFPGDQELLTLWNRVQNRYKYRDKGNDEMLLRTMRATYYACISFIDRQIGRILERLENDGLLDNTLILFTADHGEMLGDFGCVGKRSMLDGSVRVAMLAHLPGRFEAGARCEVPATLLDIVPTCLAAVGAPLPAADGRDLSELQGERTVYSQYSSGATGLYLAATRDWKYIYSAADEREWLFDLNRPSPEHHNLANNPLFLRTLENLRGELHRKLRAEGCADVLSGDSWRKFGRIELPRDPDFGLLFQDPSDAQERLNALGPDYAREVTADGRDAYKIMRPADWE